MGQSASSPSSPPKPSVEGDGLLRNSSQRAYASSIRNMAAASSLMTTPGLLWEAAVMDAPGCTSAYIALVYSEVAACIKSDDLCDCDETMDELSRRMGGCGQFVELVGAPNIGKSHMLRNLVRQLNTSTSHRAILVNARKTGSELAAGIVDSLSCLDMGFAGAFRGCSAVAAAAAELAIPGGGAVVNALRGDGTSLDTTTATELVLGFVRNCKRAGVTPVVAVDEALLARESLSGALSLFSVITKEETDANVIFAASGFAESAVLKECGFRSEALTKVVVASEVPPEQMIALLRSCSCGQALAAALTALYGGSVWSVLNALETLRGSVSDAKGFKAISALSAGTVEGPSKCFDTAGAALAVPMAAMLHSLARDGFVPLSTRSDPCAAIVRSTGVGGIVSITEHFAGAPEAAWSAGAPHAMIVVPAYQVTRLILSGDARVQAAGQQRPVPAATPRIDWWVTCPETAVETSVDGTGAVVLPSSIGPPPSYQLPPPGHVARLLQGPAVSSLHTVKPDFPAANTGAP